MPSAKLATGVEIIDELMVARRRQSWMRWLAFVRQHRLKALHSSVTACLQAPMHTPRAPNTAQPMPLAERSPDMLSAFWTPGHASSSSSPKAPPPPPALAQGDLSAYSADGWDLSCGPGKVSGVHGHSSPSPASSSEVSRIQQKLDVLESLINKTMHAQAQARTPPPNLELLEKRIQSLEEESAQKDRALLGAESRSLEAQQQVTCLTARAQELSTATAKAQEREAQLTARCAQLESEAIAERQKAVDFKTQLAEASIRELFDCGKNYSAVLVGRRKPVTEGDHLIEELCQDQARVDEIIRLASALMDSGMLAKLANRPRLLTAQLLWRVSTKLYSSVARGALQSWRRRVLAMSAQQEVLALLGERKGMGHQLEGLEPKFARTPQLTPRTDAGSVRSRLAPSPLDGPVLSVEGSEPAAEPAAELGDSPPRTPPAMPLRSSFVLGSPLAEDATQDQRNEFIEEAEPRVLGDDAASQDGAREEDLGEAEQSGARTEHEEEQRLSQSPQQGEAESGVDVHDETASNESLSALLNFA